jgi:hypothetical protein
MVIAVDGIESAPSAIVSVERELTLADTTLLDAIVGATIGLTIFVIFGLNCVFKKDIRHIWKEL